MKKIAILLVDLLLIFASIVLSFVLLKNAVLLNYTLNIGAFYYVSPAIFIMYLILAYVFGMYRLSRQAVGEMIYTIFIVSVALTICIMAACFFIRESATSYPRSVVLLSAPIYFAALVVWRVSLRGLYLRSYGQRCAMIVGQYSQGLEDRLNGKFRRFYHLKFVCREDDEMLLEKAGQVSDIFVTHDVSPAVREKIFLLPTERKQVRVFFVPSMNDISIIHARLEQFDDIPTYAFSKMFLTDEERFVKRVMDIVGSVLLFAVTSPLFLLVPLIVALDGGPVFYGQERLTRGHKRFRMLKFRTMVSGAESQSGPVLSQRNDKRVTPIGKFLRASRIDELPQLFNVMAGDMSLVGPRPERPFFTEKIEAEIPEFKFRLNVKSGMTGLAQVMGKYNTDFRQKLQYDLYYINNFSVFRDCMILLQTIGIVFLKDKSEGINP